MSEIDASGIAGARRAKLPRSLRPQLATLVSSAPDGEEWVHELKLDGYRLLAFVEGERTTFRSRNGKDWTDRVPELARELSRLSVQSAVVDGELVALRAGGASDFQALQSALGSGRSRALVYYAFDLPFCGGYDLRDASLVDRKSLLERVLSRLSSSAVRYSEHLHERGSVVLEHACSVGAEGIVSKRASSAYRSERSRIWLKVKCTKRQELVVVGYTAPKGSRKRFGALLLGYYEDEGCLRFAGQVGTGFTSDSLEEIGDELDERVRAEAPFPRGTAGVPRKDVTWVEPELVAEVEFTEWTGDGRLRHPSFKGLRADKPATEVRRERESEAGGRSG